MGGESERVAGFGRLEDGLRQAGDWYRWGPYVSERQWGTVREDYSANGEAWDYLPHDHARSRAYRWGEDGLAGFCDIEQRLCLGLAALTRRGGWPAPTRPGPSICSSPPAAKRGGRFSFGFPVDERIQHIVGLIPALCGPVRSRSAPARLWARSCRCGRTRRARRPVLR